MADDFDDFFDSPRRSRIEKNSKSGHTVNPEYTGSEDFLCDEDHRKPVGKPPAHPNSRPVSAAGKRALSGRTSPDTFERNFTDDPQAHSSRRVIEAKVPCDVMKQDGEDGSYSDDSFTPDDDGSSTEDISGRHSPTPRTVNSGQQSVSKEISVRGYDAEPFVTENNAQDLSDYSGSFSDDTTDNDDDSDVTDVSPLNTPHSPDVQTASSSSVSKNISKSSKNEPVGLLRGDRDSLDLDMLLQTVLHMEKQGRPQSRQSQTQLAVTSRGSQRNYSFTNERVKAIDKENHRLMASIMRHASAGKKAKAKANKLPTSSIGTKRLSTAAVNRAKHQQKIEAENLVNGLLSYSNFGIYET